MSALGGRLGLIATCLAGTLLGTRPASAQAPAATLAARAPGIAVMTRPGSTMVAVTLLIPAGSADDPDSIPGSARLVGEAIAQAVRWRIDPDAAQLELRVERGFTAFTLLATPQVWVRAWGVLEDVAFRVSLADPPLESARKAMLDEFTFEAGELPVRPIP